ncbi:MAG: hypothetical protein FWD69_12280, partial [Polyangiaceae bacterium]|nr:hypothetical protein [Polyangiaceae bacterium]
YNYWGGADMVATDYSIFISPPGRFPSGNSATGHADLGGNVFNMTYPTGSGTTVNWSRSGSWQGHAIGGYYSFPAQNKYWATGGRCIH